MDVTYDPCAAQVAAHADATSDEIASLDAALALWNERGGFRLVRSAEHAGDSPSLVVRFEEQFGAYRGYYDDEAGEVIVNRRMRGTARTVAIAHELGHAFGLFHVDGRASLMNRGNLSIAPTADDFAAVSALWGPCAARPRS